MKRRTVLMAAVIVAAGSIAGIPAPHASAVESRLPAVDQRAIDAIFSQYGRTSPGCAVGVFKDGAMQYARGYGMASLEHDVPITPESVFYAGSVSKQFTAFAAALAIKDGKLAYDDPVRKYLPELPDVADPIRMRHLLHHTSGLRDYNTLLAIAGRRDEDAWDTLAVLRFTARQKGLNFEP
jgi:CubicO group peptidase (beta-lactamase class C family)